MAFDGYTAPKPRLSKFSGRDEQFLLHAIDCAWRARESGDHPFGAVVVYGGRLVSACEDRAKSSGHCTLHAEIAAISAAERELGPDARSLLEQATLYSSTEPCDMCAAAIIWSGIRRVVFSCSGAEFRRLRPGLPMHDIRAFVRARSACVSIVGPACAEAGLAVHRDYWKRPI